MSYKQPSKALSNILNLNTRKSQLSLHTIIKGVQKANPDLEKGELIQTAKIIKKLNEDPKAVVTNAMSKMAINALAKAGNLKNEYKLHVGQAILKVKEAKNKEMEEAQGGPLTLQEERKLKRMESLKSRVGIRDKNYKKDRMKELARERRGEANKEELKKSAWAAHSGKSVFANDATGSTQQTEQKKVVDMLID